MAYEREVSNDARLSPEDHAPAMRMLPLLMAMALTVLLSVGGMTGVLAYLANSGRLAAWHVGETAADLAAAKTHAIVLDPLLVNLADGDGHSYLRAGLTLRVLGLAKGEKSADGDLELKDGKGAAAVSAPLRDTVLDILGRQKVSDLLVPDGKEMLKVELKQALLERDPDVKVTEIYFTEFLVQR